MPGFSSLKYEMPAKKANAWGLFCFIIMKLGGGNLKAHKHSPMAFKLGSCPFTRPPPQFVLSFLEEKQHLSGQRIDLDSKRSLETPWDKQTPGNI